MFRATILFLTLVGSVAWSDDGVDITEPSRVAALTELQEILDSVSVAVTDCVGSGKEHGQCLCENEKSVLIFNKAVADLFETYPDLRSVDIVSFRLSNGSSVSQSLSGIRKQAQTPLNCT